MPESDTKRILDQIAARRDHHRARGWDEPHDNDHTEFELPRAAVNYITTALFAKHIGLDRPPEDAGPFYKNSGDSHLKAFSWPFDTKSWKPGDYREMMIEAIGFMVAEVERFDRAEVKARVLQ